MKIKKEKKAFHWSNISGLSKRPVDFRNLITRLSLLSLFFNFEKEGSRL